MGTAYSAWSTPSDGEICLDTQNGGDSNNNGGDDVEVGRLVDFGADATRAFLMSCVDTTTGTVDVDALARAEYQHNRRAVLRVLGALSCGTRLSIGTIRCDDDDKRPYARCTDFVRAANGRFEFEGRVASNGKVPRIPCPAGDITHFASAQSQSHILYVTTLPGQGHKALRDTIRELMDGMWLSLAVRSLSSRPSTKPWTADCILRMGPLLAFLADTCAHRIGNGMGDHQAYTPLCARSHHAAGRAILNAARTIETGGSVDAAWRRAVGMEQDLRGMLAWIKALEKTDAIAQLVASHRRQRSPDTATAPSS
ncbi:hypothetical protein psal_cds_1111 [Pandoravirus salinus]|uniref:Uncharacterized protein n=1 Tax=Pandoravirus salinus TaxID=1349410 RepID=S4W0M6_9VIRU|nr:hypothetical protein psal_cds_1111 [Pandoravirus salinus]AGO85341.2 hypothetical protein psal_cds_1111 [Pandoravirus salinus]